jgi:ABC-type sulfate transport system permease component
VSRITFAAMTAVAAGVAFAFLLLPLVAIFLRVPLGDLVDQFGNQVFRDALVVSLKTSLIAPCRRAPVRDADRVSDRSQALLRARRVDHA